MQQAAQDTSEGPDGGDTLIAYLRLLRTIVAKLLRGEPLLTRSDRGYREAAEQLGCVLDPSGMAFRGVRPGYVIEVAAVEVPLTRGAQALTIPAVVSRVRFEPPLAFEFKIILRALDTVDRAPGMAEGLTGDPFLDRATRAYGDTVALGRYLDADRRYRIVRLVERYPSVEIGHDGIEVKLPGRGLVAAEHVRRIRDLEAAAQSLLGVPESASGVDRPAALNAQRSANDTPLS